MANICRSLLETISKLSFGPVCWCQPGRLQKALFDQYFVEKMSVSYGKLPFFRLILFQNSSFSPSKTVLRYALEDLVVNNECFY